MGSDFRRGLDTRDSRLDLGFILGDSDIEDSQSWSVQDRDKTCVWLNFADNHLDPRYVITTSEKEERVVDNNMCMENNIRQPDPVLNTIEVNLITQNTGVTTTENLSISATPLERLSTTTKIENQKILTCSQPNSILNNVENKTVTTTSIGKTTIIVKTEVQTVRAN